MTKIEIEAYLKQFADFKEFQIEYDNLIKFKSFDEVQQILDYIKENNYYKTNIDYEELGSLASLIESVKVNKYFFSKIDYYQNKEIELIANNEITGQASLNKHIHELDNIILLKLIKFWKKIINDLNFNNTISKALDSHLQLDNTNTLLIELSETKIENYIQFLSDSNKDLVEINHQRGKQTKKLILLHEFGIIEHLRKVWLDNNINVGMEKLISVLIDEPEKSIRPRLANPNDSKLYTPRAKEEISDFLKPYDLFIGEIKLP